MFTQAKRFSFPALTKTVKDHVPHNRAAHTVEESECKIEFIFYDGKRKNPTPWLTVELTETFTGTGTKRPTTRVVTITLKGQEEIDQLVRLVSGVDARD